MATWKYAQVRHLRLLQRIKLDVEIRRTGQLDPVARRRRPIFGPGSWLRCVKEFLVADEAPFLHLPHQQPLTPRADPVIGRLDHIARTEVLIITCLWISASVPSTAHSDPASCSQALSFISASAQQRITQSGSCISCSVAKYYPEFQA
jgi:hypothetical protein